MMSAIASHLEKIGAQLLEHSYYQDGSKFQFGSIDTNVVSFLRSEMAAEYRRQVAKFTAEALLHSQYYKR